MNEKIRLIEYVQKQGYQMTNTIGLSLITMQKSDINAYATSIGITPQKTKLLTVYEILFHGNHLWPKNKEFMLPEWFYDR